MGTPEPEEITAFAERVLAGDQRAVARAISLVEDGSAQVPALTRALFPRTGRAYTVGVTGAPGVGKSSLVAGLVRVAQERGLATGVLAIDPSSPFTGGALLGDRVRMLDRANDSGVFIRSMACRGHLRGLALAAPEAIRMLDAAGKDLIIVETVGVGQSEVDAATATDTTLVIVSPGWGDAVQAGKAGVIEIADIFVVNKADREGADEAVRDLNLMLRTGPRLAWTPPVVRTSTVTGDGIADLWEAIAQHRTWLEGSGELDRRRHDRVVQEVLTMVAARLRDAAAALMTGQGGTDLAEDLLTRRVDPHQAAVMILERFGVRSGAPGAGDPVLA